MTFLLPAKLGHRLVLASTRMEGREEKFLP